ncbi:MAG: 6-phosphogluconolactonase [Ignavibacteriae bacterium HGW-Ignavibacteriae-2]|nr:MAG: 6-phosphogluconolactonase [Ignavibacteriae bacterium HGW-Ignavibacteriae-2]
MNIIKTILCLALPITTTIASFNDNNYLYFYIGTYTDAESKGIYLYQMNIENGELVYKGVTEGVNNPSFLAIDETNSGLYAVNELTEFNGEKTGTVTAFKIDPNTKALQFLNQKITEGGAPCHVIVDSSGNYILTANYVGGNVCVIEVSDDGSLGQTTDLIQHYGSSIKINQKSPHAHSVNLDAENKFLYVADLGLDKIMIYNFDARKGTLSAAETPFVKVAPGAGPRHFVFHPNNKFAYVINELNSTVTVFGFNSMNGQLSEIETYSTLPIEFTGESFCADIHIHPNGKFLYGSNRGHNSIVTYEIDEFTGKLKFLETKSTEGVWPRNFTLDPTGNFLLVANQRSNNVTVFKINPLTGLLNFTGISENIPSPVCLLFLN